VTGRPVEPGRRRRPWLWAVFGLFLAVAVAGWILLPVAACVAAFQQWVLGLGPWGVAVFALLFIATTLVLAPDWPLSIAAGFVYGFWALPVVLAAAMIASTLSFLAARYLVRNRVRAFFVGRPRLAAIDRAVAEEGWKIVALLRLSPAVPFNLQNYLFGATAIPLRDYVIATAIGIVPGSVLYVYLGALGNAAHDGGGGAHAIFKWLLFGIGLAATVAAAIIVARKARVKLEDVALSPVHDAAGLAIPPAAVDGSTAAARTR
jgi:uncharacterized membrane protein YdjX (TVP38/TMEM64 family)